MDEPNENSGLPPTVVSVIKDFGESLLEENLASEAAIIRLQSLLYKKVSPKPNEIFEALFESEKEVEP